MTNLEDPLPSLLSALQPNYERAVPAAAWAGFARTFLQPGERVLLAVMGEGWTFTDPLLLVTDRRVMHLRRGVVLGWRLLREVAPAAITGAQFRGGALRGRITVDVRGERAISMSSRTPESAQGFVDGLNALIAGGRRR